jgi:hypothetical protein
MEAEIRDTMKDKKIKTIPYGLANYELLVQQNGYYVDKTMFLRGLEGAGNYLFFIRPRRFGKSLFLSVMEAYYDVFYKDRFEEFFKGTWIYDHPGEERGKYLVLSLNFSAVDPEPDKMETSFLNHIQDSAVDFLQRYNDYLAANPETNYFNQKIKESKSATDILSTLLLLCKGARQSLYVIIDEYDNFANTILSTVGEDAYRELTHGPGFFRSFFNGLKKGTGGTGAPVTRSFITGVSPVTMDDVTSGYNIGKNVSLEPNFNRMLGFTQDDVIEMIDYYRANGLVKHSTDYLVEIMTQWYGDYLFSRKDDVRLFNSDMVLYFLDNYMPGKELPDDMIDRNVRIDYGKLRHLIIVDRDKTRRPVSNGNFERLKEIVEKGEMSAKLVKGFPLEKLADTDNFISLLFYFGLLTVKRIELDESLLAVPNETIRRLYYDYIKEGYEETDVFSINLHHYTRLMKGLALGGEWEPLFGYITGLMRESMCLRDLITGEKSIQAFLNVYLGLSNLYIIHPEKEMNKGYSDIVMESFLARYEEIRYSYVLEIKYIKPGKGKKPGAAKVRQLKAAAGEQLKRYSMDEKFGKNIERTKLIKLVLIFSGHELIDSGEVK